jgi:hypothetical protein
MALTKVSLLNMVAAANAVDAAKAVDAIRNKSLEKLARVSSDSK